MAKTFDSIDDGLARFIGEQHVFFVATAPAGGDGHVNLSPKGLDSFRVIGPRTVAYLDVTGSGVETIAHLRADGRITVMFCTFSGPPRILRLFGRGTAVLPGDAGLDELVGRFPPTPGTRSVVRIELDRIADSCGYGVPRYEFVGPRSQMIDWAERKGPDGLREYREKNNARSIDGLPGLDPGRERR
ncbi:MAG: pyridoxamine 5'-phosphate oxidase family protein [Alphaproteobacteria bacterium]